MIKTTKVGSMILQSLNRQQNKKILHICSEQKTAIQIKSSAIEGEVLVWQDALYEGPLLRDETLNNLSSIRAEYFARRGWGEYAEIIRMFNHRNNVLSRFLKYSEIVLWFDSGLNNQLQLIQLVNWFSNQETHHVVISIVSKDRLPDFVGFVDFALLKEHQLEKLSRTKLELTNGQTSLCNLAWQVITSENPIGLLKIFRRDMSSMPYLKNAILRFVQQFPAKENGLCKTEKLIIQALKSPLIDHSDVEKIYLNVQSKEVIPFMSRSIFYAYLQTMIQSEYPIIEQKIIEQVEALELVETAEGEEEHTDVVVEEQYELKLTKVAGQVMNNWVDWVQVNGIDRWVGGVHLREGNIWRYNAELRQIMKTYV